MDTITNYEWIKNMDIETMEKFLAAVYRAGHYDHSIGYNHCDYNRKWLENEAIKWLYS